MQSAVVAIGEIPLSICATTLRLAFNKAGEWRRSKLAGGRCRLAWHYCSCCNERQESHYRAAFVRGLGRVRCLECASILRPACEAHWMGDNGRGCLHVSEVFPQDLGPLSL